MDTYDVAIVGAGPVGLFAALLLEQRGLSVGLYERWPAFYPRPRACGVDHEIIRQLQDAGLAADLQPYLDPVIGPDKTYEFLDGLGETLLKIDWNRPGASGWAQMNMFYQPDLEQLLARRLEASPRVTLKRGRELVSLQQHDGHVSLRFRSSDEPDELHDATARYVIGADGARSTVREQLEISQTDLGFEYDWLVVDVIPKEERVWRPYVVQNCDPIRPSTLVGSGPGRRRWEFMRLPGESIAGLNTTERAWELLAPWDITPDNAIVERHAVYTFRGSWADQWKKGNVFLAGDAAHLMPPFLGQGLCSGMRDAMALCWRLDAVLRTGAPETLLDSYGPERSEHVQEIIRQAVEIGRLICMLDPAEVAARDARMKEAMKNPALALKPPPEPRLGSAGGWRAGDRHAGFLSMQGRVRRGVHEGLFDDVVGQGWQLLLRDGNSESGDHASATNSIRRLGGVVADFGPKGDTIDIDGTYGRWFDQLGADAVLVRPDFYVFGTSQASRTGQLLDDALGLLGLGAAVPPTPADAPSAALQQEFKSAMRRLAATVCIISTAGEEGWHGMTATAVTSVSTDPPSVLVCVNTTASLHRVLHSGTRFCVNLLRASQESYAGTFSSSKIRGTDRFSEDAWKANEEQSGLPYLVEAQANLFCDIDSMVPYGTHTIFIGRVNAVRNGDLVSPLLYADGQYLATRRVPNYPVDTLFLHRWSPRAFTAEPIAETQLMTLLEAARWAPSCFNSQPWRFLYARRDTPDWNRFVGLLTPDNQSWARNASALVVVVSNTVMRNPATAGGNDWVPSWTHSFDAGAAWAQLGLQCTLSGLRAHGIIGIDMARARAELNVPGHYRIEAAVAIGRQAAIDTLEDGLQQKEHPSVREPLSVIALRGGFPAEAA